MVIPWYSHGITMVKCVVAALTKPRYFTMHITMVICMVKCMVHQPHQGGNYQVNSEFMCIWFFWWSSYHHGNTLVLPWYFHHGKNHRNTRSTFLIFFLKIISSDLSRILLKDTFTMVLPWYYRGVTMVVPLHTIYM